MIRISIRFLLSFLILIPSFSMAGAIEDAAEGMMDKPEGNPVSADPNKTQTMQDLASESRRNVQEYRTWTKKVTSRNGRLVAPVCLSVPPTCYLAGSSTPCLVVTAACAYLYMTRNDVRRFDNDILGPAEEKEYEKCVAVTQIENCPPPGSGMEDTEVPPENPSTAGAGSTSDAMPASIQQLVKNKELIVDVKNRTVTNKKGESISFKSGASVASALSAAGMKKQASEIKEFSDLLERGPDSLSASNKLKNKSVSDTSSFGGGSSANKGADGVSGGQDLFMFGLKRKNKNNGINRDPSQVRGLATTFNGEPVGIAQDNLFGMIQRQYDVQEQRGKVDATLTARPSR